MRIAILNYADVANFGDVLFPFIAGHELAARLPTAEIAFFSPTECDLGEFRSARYDRQVLATYDAILMCGGEVIHREDGMLRAIYARFGRHTIERPTDLVFDWADLPVPFKAWIGVGMPPPSDDVAHDVGRAAAGLNLIVARGDGTRGRLLASGAPEDRVETSPDLGWLIPRVSARRGGCAQGVLPKQPYVTVHAMPQLVWPGFLEAAAVTLRALHDRFGVNIVGLPLTTCWGDESTLESLAELTGGVLHLVDHRLDVFTKANVLASSVFHVGQSMHGLITTLAAGRPGGVAYPDGDDKFRELLNYLGAPEWRTEDLRSLDELVDRMARVRPADVLDRSARAVAAVDEMFDRLAHRLSAAITSPMHPARH